MGGARVGARPVAALREPSSRRLRRIIHIAHERAARRPGSWEKRAPQTGGEARTRTVTGADETVVRAKGETTVIGMVADAETGQVLGLDVLVERDSDGFMEWPGRLGVV